LSNGKVECDTLYGLPVFYYYITMLKIMVIGSVGREHTPAYRNDAGISEAGETNG
jgi:hypothetical protein